MKNTEQKNLSVNTLVLDEVFDIDELFDKLKFVRKTSDN